MKTFSKILTFGAITATLATMQVGCSSDNMPQPGRQEVTEAGYLTVNFQLPTQPSTSTRANDVFEDGLTQEYAFKNAAILLFTGTLADEANAKFQYAYEIKQPSSVDGNDGTNITTTYRKAIKVNEIKMGENEHILGLVMLNYDKVLGNVSENGTNTLTIGGKTVTGNTISTVAEETEDGGESTSTGNTTFSQILALTADLPNSAKTVADSEESTDTDPSGTTVDMYDNPFIVDNGDNGHAFFMTNTVLCNKPGGASDPSVSGSKLTVLADLGTELYSSAAEALEKSSGTVFVERGVAKVTVSSTQNMAVGFTWKASDAETDAAAPTATLEAFKLGNLDYSSYVVRNMKDTYLGYASNITGVSEQDKYRFVGSLKMGSSPWQENVDYYRTYWAETPCYENGRGFHASYTDYAKGIGNDYPLYCFENTFTVEHQDYDNTTRAVLKVKFSASDFYIINENDEVYYTKANAETRIVKYITDNPAMQTEIKTALEKKAETTGEGETEETTTVNYADYIVVNCKTDSETGQYKVESITPTSLEGKSSFDCEADLKKAVNAEVNVKEYKGGVAYYPIVIKHFGDDMTPWAHADDSETSYTRVEDAYGTGDDAAKNYLGRYGLVRNNWYDIQVSGIMKLGSPVDPTTGTITNLPDDNNEVLKYIAFKVNSMKWAKRTHNYILK